MNISPAGIALIKKFEGLRLDAYQCSANVWTIGWGTTRLPSGPVQPGMRITESQAEQYLLDDVRYFEKRVNELVSVPLTQNQFDALVSFSYNVGDHALETSTLLKMLNRGDYEHAAEEFDKWNRADGNVLPGLVKRRAEERALFTQPASGVEAVGTTQPPAASILDKVRDTVSPLLIPAISAVVDAIPSLVKLFGSGSKVAERNAKAVGVVADVVRTVTKESSVAAGVEKVLADPAMQEEVEKAVQARWYELSEVGGGIEAARKHDADFRAKGDSVWKSPSFIVALMLIPLVYIGMVSASLRLPVFPDWPFEIRVAIVSSVIGMVLGGIVGYYFGMMTSRNRAAVAQEK